MSDPDRLRVCTCKSPLHTPDLSHLTHVERAAMEPRLRWPNGATLTYAFHSGDGDGLGEFSVPVEKALRDEFRKAAGIVARYVNLTFRELLPHQDDVTPAHIRVEFVDDGASWSLVGTDCLSAPANEATTHIGWPNDLARSTHEFCHALGLMHNQAIPNHELHLDPARCYAYFGGPPNNWSKEDVDSQVLYLFRGAYVGSGFDRDSVMQYAVPDELTTDGKGIGWNQVLSPADIRDLASYYPGRFTPAPVAPAVGTVALTQGTSAVSPIVTSILALLKFVNGNINVTKLIEVVGAAEMAEPGLSSAIAAVKTHEAEIFETELGRVMADALLSAAANLAGK